MPKIKLTKDFSNKKKDQTMKVDPGEAARLVKHLKVAKYVSDKAPEPPKPKAAKKSTPKKK